jgi:hypothetical protein
VDTRTIKPAFWLNSDLAALPEGYCLLAIALLNIADNCGYFAADYQILKDAAFPFRKISWSIGDALFSLVKIGYIEIYALSDGRRYGKVINFRKHQDPPSAYSKIEPLLKGAEVLAIPHFENSSESAMDAIDRAFAKLQEADLLSRHDKPIGFRNCAKGIMAAYACSVTEAVDIIYAKVRQMRNDYYKANKTPLENRYQRSLHKMMVTEFGDIARQMRTNGIPSLLMEDTVSPISGDEFIDFPLEDEHVEKFHDVYRSLNLYTLSDVHKRCVFPCRKRRVLYVWKEMVKILVLSANPYVEWEIIVGKPPAR